MIQAIFFDAFGTLCEIQDKRNPYRPIIRAWPSGVADAFQTLMTCPYSAAELAQKAKLTSETTQVIEENLALEVASIQLYPEVIGVLEAIKKCGLKWGIISNLATPYATPLLKLLPFTPDVCAWSFEVGYRKPEHGIYYHTCKALNIDPASVLMTGDSLENDYTTPKQLDMQARYLKRQQSISHDASRLNTITNLVEILPLIHP